METLTIIFFIIAALLIAAYCIPRLNNKIEHLTFLEKFIYLKGRVDNDPITKENFNSIDAEFRNIECSAADRKRVNWLWCDFLFRFEAVDDQYRVKK